MSTITTMRKFIANQAETILIIRDAHYADESTLVPLYGRAEDGTFNANGKFDGLGEPMLLDDLDMINGLLDGVYIPWPFRIAESGVYMYDTESKEYAKICNDEMWLGLQAEKEECFEMETA